MKTLANLSLTIATLLLIAIFVYGLTGCKTTKQSYAYACSHIYKFKKDSCYYFFIPVDRRSARQMDFGEQFVSRKDVLGKWNKKDTLWTDLKKEVK